MDNMEEKISSILNDPQMMQQILSMAQSIGNAPMKSDAPQRSEAMPEIDLAMVQKLSGFAQRSGIDKREKALLGALGAYLSKDRVGKLEKAMRAAKMAKLASSTFGLKGLTSITGR